jgi:hypothetical protein
MPFAPQNLRRVVIRIENMQLFCSHLTISRALKESFQARNTRTTEKLSAFMAFEFKKKEKNCNSATK